MNKEQEVETIHGFSIPKRELTSEESDRTITWDRFDQFHHDAGEDFVEQCESLYNHQIFIGWCLHKYPEKNKELLRIVNSEYGGVQKVLHLFEEENYEKGCEKFYTDFAEFLNLTENAKKRTNQILIQVHEYYNQ